MGTNSDTGINTGTIYRPADLGGTEKYPILVWGDGGCSQDDLSNQAAMGEIASHGYFVIADGTPGSTAANGSGVLGVPAKWRTRMVCGTSTHLAWLNWQLKGDETAIGKALLVGSSCKYCTASRWEFKSANLP